MSGNVCIRNVHCLSPGWDVSSRACVSVQFTVAWPWMGLAEYMIKYDSTGTINTRSFILDFYRDFP